MIPLTSTKRTTTSYFKTQEKTTTEDVVFRDALLFVCHSKAVNRWHNTPTVVSASLSASTGLVI